MKDLRHRSQPAAPRPPAARDAVGAAIQRHARRLLTRTIGRRMLALLALGIAALLLVVALDHVWPHGLPALGRAIARRGGAGVLAIAALSLTVLTLARRLSRAYAARQLERAAGVPHNALLNAVMLAEAPTRAYAAEAAFTQAARALRAPGTPAPAGLRDSFLPWAGLAAALALWLLYALLAPKPVGPSLARIIAGDDQPAPTAVRLQLIRPGPDDVVHAGEPLEIEIAVLGRPVRELRFEVLVPDAEPPQVRRTYSSTEPVGAAGDRHLLTLPPFEVQGDIRYRCHAGDGRLEGVIPVQPQPDILRLEITLEPPAYTGLPRTVVSRPDLDVPVGTQATFHIVANTELRDPVLILRASRELRTRMPISRRDPRAAAVTLTLVESGVYTITFGDPWAVPRRDPPWHRVQVRADQPPRIEVIVPSEADAPQAVDAAEWPELVALAEDDLGLANVTFVLEQGGVVARRPLWLAGGTPRVRRLVRLPASALGADPGRPARLWFEATDGRVLPDGRHAPQTGRSRVLELSSLPPQTDPPTPVREPTDEQESDDTTTSPATADDDASGDLPGAEEGAGDDADQPDIPGEEGEQADAPSAADDLEEFLGEHGEDAGELGEQLGQSPTGGEAPASQPATDGSGRPPGRPSEGEDGGQPPSRPSEGEGSGQPPSRPSEGEGSGRPPSRPSEDEQGGDQPTSQPTEDQAPAPQDDSGEPGHAGGAAPLNPDDLAPAAVPDTPAAAEGELVPPSPPASAPALDSTGLAETLDLLEMLERGEPVDEQMLIDLGWPAARAAAFIKDLERLHERTQAAGGVARLRQVLFDTRVGSTTPEAGAGLSEDIRRHVDDRTSGPRDDLPTAGPPAEQAVPADLVALLEAYYRSLAAHSAEQTP